MIWTAKGIMKQCNNRQAKDDYNYAWQEQKRIGFA
jgi:hypothetical protein